MKSTWFADKRRYEFGKCIRDADYSHMIWDTFGGFLTCASYALRQGVHKLQTGELSDEIEETVTKEQKRFKNWGRFSDAMGILTMALEDEAYDFLGTFMGEMEMNDSKWKGQCFTPTSLCRMMADLTLSDWEPKDGETLMLNEPACGGGAMVIAASEVLKGKGFYPWHYYWVAVDVDWRCFAMAYIQLTLLGIPANVIQGNTLSLEVFSEAVTFAGAMHPPKQRRTAEPERNPTQKQFVKDLEGEPKSVAQRTLF